MPQTILNLTFSFIVKQTLFNLDCKAALQWVFAREWGAELESVH